MSRKLTVAALLKVIPKLPSNAEVKPVPVLVVVLAADLGPLEDNLEGHEQVHRDDAEPQEPSLPAVADPNQRHGKRRLGQRLPDERAARRDVDEDVHAVVPFLRRVFENIPRCELVDNEAVVGEQYKLHIVRTTATTHYKEIHQTYPADNEDIVIVPQLVAPTQLHPEPQRHKRRRAGKQRPQARIELHEGRNKRVDFLPVRVEAAGGYYHGGGHEYLRMLHILRV